MQKQKFLTKSLKTYMNWGQGKEPTFQKPQICPHCGVCVDAEKVSVQRYPYTEGCSRDIIVFIWRCTACRKIFVSLHTLEGRAVGYVGTYPQYTPGYEDKQLEKISPRFIEMYNQAIRAETNNDYNLAAIGFRTALEILIKDYAINCLGESKEKVVKLNLYNAILEYLGDSDELKTADVIRILGNDHTHYERKYPDLDFALLKNYVDIFLPQIRNKILIKTPPVCR